MSSHHTIYKYQIINEVHIQIIIKLNFITLGGCNIKNGTLCNGEKIVFSY